MQNKSYIVISRYKNIFKLIKNNFCSCILQLDERKNCYIKHVKHRHENL